MYDADESGPNDDLRLLELARLRALCLGAGMFPVVCMFRAGLYVGLGAFGMDMAQSVSNFDGRDGTVPFSGMPRGPSGLEKLLPQFPLSTPGVGIESGAPFEEDIELLELGRVDSD